MIPENLKYTKDHEWVKVEGTNVTIGITDFAQSQLGDVTFIDVSTIGKTVKKHDTIAAIESVKAASDVYSPVTGKVTTSNAELANKPELVNQDPYGNGWICKMEGINAADLSDLMDARQYTQFIAGK